MERMLLLAASAVLSTVVASLIPRHAWTPVLACVQAAAEAPGSVERMLLLAVFAVSAYSSTAGRTSKPFNPLLGETYELVHAQKGFRAIVEKVGGGRSLLPPAAGKAFRMSGSEGPLRRC